MWPRNAEEAIGWPVKINLGNETETYQVNGEITAYDSDTGYLTVRAPMFTFQVKPPMPL